MAIKYHSNIRLMDNNILQIGTGGDLKLEHTGTHSNIYNTTGNLNFINYADDKDITFQCDDGSGGVETYFFLDGSAGGSDPATVFPDNSYLHFGGGFDLNIGHNGSTSYITNNTGNLYIRNSSDDSDIIFQSDDGSGGTTAYLTLDGSATRIFVEQHMQFDDNKKVRLGSGADLEIYHDGSNSYINDTGTGDLRIKASNNINFYSESSSEVMAKMINDGGVELYHNAVKKFETTSGGVNVTGNVGIGTTSPSAGSMLEVIGKGDQLGSTGFYVNSSFKDDNNVGVFICHDDTVNNTGAIAGINQLSFVTYGGSSPAWGERMKITGAGDVGIGTTSPSQKLHVDGKIRANSWFQGADGTNTLWASTSEGILIETPGSTSNNNDSKIYFRNSGNTVKHTFDTNNGNATFAGKLEINQAGTGTSNLPSAVAEFSGQAAGGVLKALSLVNSVTAASGNGTQLAFHNASNYSPTGTITTTQAGDVTEDSKMEFQIYNGGLQTALTIDHESNATFAGNLTIPEKIIHSGDTNTYFGFDLGADTFRVVAGGTEKLKTAAAGIEVNGELQADSLDIDGAADISNKLTLSSDNYNEHLAMRRGSYGYDTIITGTRIDFSPTSATDTFKFLANTQTTGSLTATSLDINGNADISGDLGVAGNIYQTESGTTSGIGVFMPMVKGGLKVTSSQGTTGRLRIKVPTYKSNTMQTFYVDVYEYDTDRSATYRVSGYNYSDTNATWYNTTVVTLLDSDNRDLTVRFGADTSASEQYVAIGEVNTTWNYVQVVVRDYMGGYNTSVSEATAAFEIEFVTTDNATYNVNHDNNQPFANWSKIESIPSNVTNALPTTGGTMSGALHIDSGSSTSQALIVEAASDPLLRFRENGSSAGYIQCTLADFVYYNAGGGKFSWLENGGVEKMSLTDAGQLTVAGEIEGGSLDINGNADISGTLNVHNNLSLQDSDILSLGVGDDLQIYHDGTDNHIDATSTLNIATGTSGVAVKIGHTTSEVLIADNLTIDGNLTTKGDFIIESTSNVAIKDTIITLNDGTSGTNGTDSNDIGIMLERHGNNKFMGWDESKSYFILAENTQDVSVAVTGLTYGTLQTLRANVQVDTIYFGDENPTSISALKDEDDMASNSATALATQQSIKAYADTMLPLAGGTMTGALTVNLNGDALNLRSTTNAQPTRITFSSDVPDEQIGHIEYTHSNTASYGGGEAFIIGGTETTVILADGQLMYKDGIYSKPGSGTGAGTRKDVNWDTAYTYSQVGHLPLAGGTMSGAIAMGDNDVTGIDELIFTSGTKLGDSGADNYLTLTYGDSAGGGVQIYDGNGTRQGYLYGDGNVTPSFGLLDGSGSWAVKCLRDSYVELRHDNAVKFQTKSDGVDITGELQADTLDIDGNADITGTLTINGTNTLLIESNSTAATFNLNSGTRGFDFINNNATLLSLTSGGNATFAGDVNTGDDLNVGDDVNIAGDQLTFTNDAASAYIRGADTLIIESDHDNDDGSSKPIYFYTNGTEMARMEATAATFAGSVTATHGRFTSTGDASVGSTLHAFQAGTTSGTNIIIDNNEIMARNNGATSALNINPDGGDVNFHPNGNTSTIDSSGNATFAGTTTVEGGILHLGKADTASGHVNAKELMTFNIDTDNDDTNRYFGFYVNGESGSGTELLKILETGDATFAGDITITDISGTRGISRNNTGYNLQLMGGTDNTDGAFISLSGETRGGAANSYNGRIEIYSGGGGLANQAAALGDIIFGTKWNGGSSNILVLDSSTNNATFAGTTTFNDSSYFSNRGIISWGSIGGGTGFGIRAESGNALSLGSNGAWDKIIIDTSGNTTFAGDITVGANKIGRDADNLLDFSTDNQIVFRLNGGNELSLDANQLYPTTDDGLALGYIDNGFSDLHLASGAVINFNGNDVTLTHSGNKLSLNGGFLQAENFSGLLLGDRHAKTSFELPYFTHSTADLAVDIYLGNDYYAGVLELRLTSGYSNQNAVGEAYFKWVVGLNTNGSMWFTPKLAESFVTSQQSTQIYVDNPAWDSTNSRYFIRVYHKVNTGNQWEGTLAFTSQGQSDHILSNVSVGSLLTSTTTSGVHPVGLHVNDQVNIPDSTELRFGDRVDSGVHVGDFAFQHNGTHNLIKSHTGDLKLINYQDDGDIIFYSDDGSGGITEYITIDGSAATVEIAKATNLAGHLTITGGSDIFLADNGKTHYGASNDLEVYHTGTTSYIVAKGTGDLILEQQTNDKDIIFKSDDGSGGTTEYFRLDGSSVFNVFNKQVYLPDNVQTTFGDGSDLKIWHDGTDSVIQNETGDLEFQNRQNDGDIVFKSDDGSGGVTPYFTLDGSNTNIAVAKTMVFADNIKASFGASEDLRIQHSPDQSYIQNYTGDFHIQQRAVDKDLKLYADDGSGGVAEYFRLDGSAAEHNGTATTALYTNWPDNSRISVGSGNDLQLDHNGTDSVIRNETGDLYIMNKADDKDIIFQSDNGAGGVQDYIRLDGSAENIKVYKNMNFQDNDVIQVGTSGDLQIYHDGNHSYMSHGGTGKLFIQQNTNDQDIVFQCDDGSGGTTAYLTIAGADGHTVANKEINFLDSVECTFGHGSDLKIAHISGNNYITGTNGDLYIRNGSAADKDIIFQADNGSGGNAEYFRLDGGGELTYFSKHLQMADNVNIYAGSSGDLAIYHDGTNSYINNATGKLFINNQANDSDIIFRCDDGSGGAAEYFRVDGSSEAIIISKATQHGDNVKAYYGGGNDLAIYHDGSNSYIDDTGTGSLFVRGSDIFIKANTSENAIIARANAAVELYHNNALKLETTAYGVKTSYAATSNTDGDAAGDIVNLGETTTVAGKIYYYTSSGAWELADADAVATAKGMLGVALGTSSNTHGMLIRGMVTLDHDPGTIADTLFLSTTAGAATATAPSGTGDIVRVIGYCLNSTNGQIYFNPDGAFVEVTAG